MAGSMHGQSRMAMAIIDSFDEIKHLMAAETQWPRLSSSEIPFVLDHGWMQ